MMLVKDSSHLQSANIVTQEAGLIERPYRPGHRRGNRLMANRTPSERELRIWCVKSRVVFPDQPQRVDFVMLLASHPARNGRDLRSPPRRARAEA